MRLSLSALVSTITRPVLRLPYSRTCIAALRSRWRTHVWIVAPPKSGSTWLTHLLNQGLGWPCVPLSAAVGACEQEADLTQLVARAALHGHVISPNQHCRYSANTHKCVTSAGIKVILLTRNLADSLVSFRDHVNRGDCTWPMAHIQHDQWRTLDDARRLDFIVDLVAPWYINFYAGWFNSPLIGTDHVVRLRYEDLLADPEAELARLYVRLGIRDPARPPKAAVAAAAEMDTRKNQARAGRGAQLLSDAQQARLAGFLRYYPGTDFSSISGCDQAARTYASSVCSAHRCQVNPAA